MAGGICQVATTLFQAVFWSGYQIEERNWHLYWIPSYTSRNVVGLDATVDEDSGLDFKFANTTQNYLLVQSWIDASYNVNFALYGTPPPWTVKIESIPMMDRVEPETGTLIQEEPTLPKGQRLAVEGAQAEFTSTVVRHVIPTEGDERTLRMTSRVSTGAQCDHGWYGRSRQRAAYRRWQRARVRRRLGHEHAGAANGTARSANGGAVIRGSKTYRATCACWTANGASQDRRGANSSSDRRASQADGCRCDSHARPGQADRCTATGPALGFQSLPLAV